MAENTAQCQTMMNFAELASVSSDRPALLTDQLPGNPPIPATSHW